MTQPETLRVMKRGLKETGVESAAIKCHFCLKISGNLILN